MFFLLCSLIIRVSGKRPQSLKGPNIAYSCVLVSNKIYLCPPPWLPDSPSAITTVLGLLLKYGIVNKHALSY